MAVFSIQNEQLCVTVDTFGAELKSLKKAFSDREYMWDAKPEYWKRTSPVLFPIVGSLKNGSYRYGGREYTMSQHGFARDMEFALMKQTENEMVFVLESDNGTLELYPFEFALEIGYRLDENNLIISWKVTNCGNKEMYFSIGGHPAFMCPIDSGSVQTDYQILFDTNDTIIASTLGNNGTLTMRKKVYVLENGYMKIGTSLFDDDALIIEDNQAHKVSLCDNQGRPYLTVSFDAPLFGIWSPAKKNAPFVCIEPWYGRCDKCTFEGELSQREWGNKLSQDEVFYAEYMITV